jgi:transcriptional regulator with XRE-family HTH domain
MGSKKPWDQRRLRLQKLLRDVRLEAGLKQAELADRLESDQSFVSRYERGERRLDLVELEQICAACKIKLTELVQRYCSHSGRG